MPRTDLVTLGESFEDLVFLELPRLPGPGEEIKTSRFARSNGGGALHTAVAAARLGSRCRVVSALSEPAVELLARERIGIVNLRRPGEPHAISAALSTRSDRSFVTFNGVNDRLEGRLHAATRAERARHLHFAFFPRDCRRWQRVVEAARKRGASTSWDFGWNEALLRDRGFPALVAALDFVFLNEAEALLYAGQRSLKKAIEHWRDHSRNAVIKLGARGSRWVSAEIRARAATRKVRVVDTTGAGDAFDGGFLDAWLRGADADACLRSGNRMGTLSTRKPGGIAGLPPRRRR